MSERDLIEATPAPRTRESLANDLRRLGLTPGMTAIVHSSMSKLGWVCGGPVTVVQALTDIVTESGTLVMPTQTGDLSDPANWMDPPVPRGWWKTIREELPAYDPRTTPTRGMGRVVETFRNWPGALRSSHPRLSFAAWGGNAEYIVGEHPLDYPLGEGSPLARVYELDGGILLLGAGHESNTSFHLAEYRAPGARQTTAGAPVTENGRRVWKTYRDIDLDEEPFQEIGTDLEAELGASEEMRASHVGSAASRLISQRAAVDFAEAWLTRRRKQT